MANPPTTSRPQSTARVFDTTLAYQSLRLDSPEALRRAYWEDAWMRPSDLLDVKHPHLKLKSTPDSHRPLALTEF